MDKKLSGFDDGWQNPFLTTTGRKCTWEHCKYSLEDPLGMGNLVPSDSWGVYLGAPLLPLKAAMPPPLLVAYRYLQYSLFPLPCKCSSLL